MTLARAVLIAPAALAACVAPQTAPQGSAARAGAHEVQVDGVTYLATLMHGAPGVMHTAEGARAVPGATLRVTRPGTALAMDEGAAAKKAARAGCAAADGRFSEVALGAYDRATAAWVFAGGCA